MTVLGIFFLFLYINLYCDHSLDPSPQTGADMVPVRVHNIGLYGGLSEIIIRQSFFFLPSNLKNLGLSYKMNL